MTTSVAELAKKKCKPCEGGVTPLTREQAENYLKVVPSWQLSPDGKSLKIQYVMEGFMAAVELIQKIAEIAEEEDHHPDLHLTSYRKLSIELSTHAIGGLSENDFILAAKIDQLPKKLKVPK